jgi:hypothetical protein
MNLNFVNIKSGRHNIYENEEIAHRICSDVLNLCSNYPEKSDQNKLLLN